MTSEIKDELIEDIKKICRKFGINQVINEEYKDEITGEQYENMKFPVIFYNIYNGNPSYAIDYENNKYRYEDQLEVILTLESREPADKFNILYLFLQNTKATNEYFEDRKHKRKIRNIFKLQETVTKFNGRKYFEKVLQFTYLAEHLINKDFK